DAHDASYDVAATARCFFGLIKVKVVKPLADVAIADIEYEEPELEAGNSTKREKKKKAGYEQDGQTGTLTDKPFHHLHVHSQFSVLQATPEVKDIVLKAKEWGMNTVALTDFGNMYGAFEFVSEALKHEVKPIVGCEFFVSYTRKTTAFKKDN